MFEVSVTRLNAIVRTEEVQILMGESQSMLSTQKSSTVNIN